MSASYKKFLKLLEKWPIDKTKPGRDLGDYLRKQLKARLRSENIAHVNELYVANQFEALDRLCNNVHFSNHKRKFASTATGLTREEAQIVLSDSTLQFLAEQKTNSVWNRFRKIKNVPTKDGDATQ